METQEKFASQAGWISVATIEGIAQQFPQAASFRDKKLTFETGQSVDFEDLLKKLQSIGLKREDMVEQVGDFCVRGGIVDLFVWNFDDPLRIEFFGDTIESIRRFDVFNQRSTGHLNEIIILPNLKNENGVFIDELLPADTIIFLEDIDAAGSGIEKNFAAAQSIFLENKQAGVEENEPAKRYLSKEKFDKILENYSIVDTNLVSPKNALKIDFNVKPHPEFNGSAKLFLEYLDKQTKKIPNPRIIIQCGSHNQSDRLQDIIDEEDIPFNGKVVSGTIHNGFMAPEMNLQILTDHEIFNRFKRRMTYKRFKSGEYLRQLSSLNLYDYVVHIDYGIGRFMGMEMLDLGQVKKECIKVAYRDGDNLFVTVDRLNRIQKFSSEDGPAPRLTKLGTTEWERAKTKTKESVKKIASELISIYAQRKALGGIHFSADNQWQKELEASFVFEETEDQIKSIAEVKNDMESDEPMDRLLCGDVGFGKTEVALRAAFKAIMDGRQAAILAPTTILAFQHYQTFKDRLVEFPVNVSLLNRFRTQKEQKRILEELAAGKVDLIVGTHRILSNDVRFKDLGLLVIDEEQRFGVKQKEKLKQYRYSVDVLSMTATPIPRSLHMALMGARDFSNIDTPPSNRLPIHTEIINWDDDRLNYLIMKEISRGGQVYFVHNRVETILGIKEALSQIVPDARIAVGHGQLPERKLEKVIFDFMQNKYDVLLATMIIENGLDIPNVNTIIVNRADKLGLSQLYQLRGRVGRSSNQAYAYLLVPSQDKITATARKRLRAIQDFTDLGSGYKVALRDLEIRGAGNLLGKEQSGFVQSVGFDMYCRILDEAVKELKQGGAQPEIPVTVSNDIDIKLDVDFDLLIPDKYILSEMERISIYHRLVNFSDIEQVESVKSELDDRFGNLPQEVHQFLKAVELKILAAKIFASRLVLKGSSLKLFFSKDAQNNERFFDTIIPNFLNQGMTKIRFIEKPELSVIISLKGADRIENMDFAKKILQAVLNND